MIRHPIGSIHREARLLYFFFQTLVRVTPFADFPMMAFYILMLRAHLS